jgi:NitT/TauT family transport system substrate-binding protein
MNRFRYITVLVVIVVLVLSLALQGCTPKPAVNDDKVLVRLNEVVRSIFYAPMYVAINKGFYEEEGLEIDLTTAWGGDKSMTALLSNAADIALIGSETSIYVYNQGRDNYIVNFAQLTQKDGSFLIGRNPEPDFKWENIKGKLVIGARPGGMPQMVHEYILKSHGVIPGQDMEFVTNIQFTATAGAFVGGTGDYVALFEPTGSQLEKENQGYIVASMGATAGEIPYTVFMATKDFIGRNPDIIQRFTNATYKGQQWVLNNPSKEIAREIAPFFPDTSEDILIKVIDRYKNQDTWPKNPIMKEEAFERLQNIMDMAGKLTKRTPFNQLVDNSFAEKAVKDK